MRLIDVAYGPNVITWENVFQIDVNVETWKKYYLPFKLGEGKLRTYHIQAQIG